MVKKYLFILLLLLLPLVMGPTAPTGGGPIGYPPSGVLDADLVAIAALTTTAYGRALLELANEAALQALITSPWADADVADSLTLSLLKMTALTAEPTEVVGEIYRADGDTWDPAGLGITDDYWVVCTATGTPGTFVALWDITGKFYMSSLQLPYTTSGDNVLTQGLIIQKSNEDAISLHGGATGEVQDEVLISMLRHEKMTFDPKVVCDGDVDRLFIMTVGDDAPSGITLTEWKLSFEADPTTEFAASQVHLKYADAFIGVANAAEMDDLATTAGAASADTGFDASTVANSKVIYLQFDSAYTETGHQVIFEMWYFANED